MLNAIYDDPIGANHKHKPMRSPRADAKGKLPELDGRPAILSRQGASFGTIAERVQGPFASTMPSLGLLVGTVLCPPRAAILNVGQCLGGQMNRKRH
jgi:hypothetical protein